MPNKYNFNVLPGHHGSADDLVCIEKDCNFAGKPWNLDEDSQLEHFLTHSHEPQTVANEDGIVYEIRGDERVQACRDCGNEFVQPRRRGRPRLTCDECKNV